METKRLLFVAQEMDPYLAITEMANLVKKLAPISNDNGWEVRVLMPRFGVVNERRNRLHEVVRLSGINIIIDDLDYPLIIKVASLPGTRIQVYFLDNEEFFKRKAVFRDEDEKFFDDNGERMIFFCKSLIETVRKFGWTPNIIHCHGWFTSLIPLYLKTHYAKDPIFANSKIVYSLYEQEFKEKFNKKLLKKAKISDLVKEKDIELLEGLNNDALNKIGIKYAHAVTVGSDQIKDVAELKKLAGKKPFLNYQEEVDVQLNYLDFFNKLIE
ncbi:MAG: glycogen/starch synthase [Sphingobacteriales bacterium]|jgi:starch synthase|nr:MAG: glycogen/starch synthase [Sphingobacteriales bacterium]